MPIPTNVMFNYMITIKGSAATGGAGVKAVYNVFTYARNSSVPPITKLSLYTAFSLNVIAPLALAMNVRWSANSVAIRNIDDFNDAEQDFADAAIGARVLDSLPLNSCVSILLRTALRGKNYRGAKHFGPASEEDTTQDILTGAGLARWQAVRDACKATWIDGNGNQWVPTVFSRNLSGINVLPIANIVANDVTDALLDKNIGTMKHRRSRTIR